MWEWLDMIKGKWFNEIKKNTEWIFVIIEWLCTHTANTHFSSNNCVKVHVASNVPFKWTEKISTYLVNITRSFQQSYENNVRLNASQLVVNILLHYSAMTDSQIERYSHFKRHVEIARRGMVFHTISFQWCHYNVSLHHLKRSNTKYFNYSLLLYWFRMTEYIFFYFLE